MVKLERGDKPEFWTEENIQKWVKRWQKNANWRWPQVDGKPISHSAKEIMLLWHYHKCAFCEIQADENLQIEHFKSKQHHQNEAFDWPNLFLSCATCNQTKGDQNCGNCLKPDLDDPAEYLWVDPILLKVAPKPGIDETAKKRAEQTIKLYGLDRPELSRAYLLYWRTAALHNGPPPIHELTMNSPDIGWIGEFIQKNLPEVWKRAQATEEYSLMTYWLISYLEKALGQLKR